MKFKPIARKIVTTILPIVGGLAVLVLIIAWLAGMFTTKIQPGKVPVDSRGLGAQPTYVVQEILQDYTHESVGSLKAESRTVISAKVLATISEITVAAGDEVQPGQVLVRLDTKDLEARLRQAEQALEAARATREQAAASFRRAESVRKQEPGAIAQQDYDARKAAADRARAGYLSAEQAVNEAGVMLSYGTIGAPKAGRIVDRLAEPGDTASPGKPLLVVYDATSMRLEAPVIESLAVKLSVGQQLKVRIDALDREFDGTVDEIVPLKPGSPTA